MARELNLLTWVISISSILIPLGVKTGARLVSRRRALWVKAGLLRPSNRYQELPEAGQGKPNGLPAGAPQVTGGSSESLCRWRPGHSRTQVGQAAVTVGPALSTLQPRPPSPSPTPATRPSHPR